MKQPSAREIRKSLWDLVCPLYPESRAELTSLLYELERAAAHKAMMRCARLFPDGHQPTPEWIRERIRSEARKLKAKVRE